MYRGKNQEQYIAEKQREKIYLYALWGRIPRSLLKGFSLGIRALKKRVMVFFLGNKRYGQIRHFDRGKNV